jgi:hypothetical protein
VTLLCLGNEKSSSIFEKSGFCIMDQIIKNRVHYRNGFGWLLLSLVLVSLSLNKWRGDAGRVIWADAEGYYMYLPAVFIYGGFTGMPLRTPGWPEVDGKTYTKFTCGVAMMQMPFFLVVHGYLNYIGKPTDGFSNANGLSVIFASVFYLLLGMYFLYSWLIKYFPSRRLVVGALIALLVGTNLYYYAIAESGMSHIYSFGLFAGIVYFTDRLYARPGKWLFLVVGLLFGLAVLIRPTAIVLLALVLFYGMRSGKDIKDRFAFFFRNWRLVLGSILAFIIVFIPQMFYWKYTQGQWIVYSYGSTEGFDYWTSPKIFQVLGHLENGLFLYSPLVVLAFGGMLYLAWKRKFSGHIFMIVLAAATYLFGSWWDWNFGGAFGHRCFVEYYAILSLPFVFVIDKIANIPSRILKSLCFLTIAFLIFYSMHMTYAYASPWDGPDWTWERFWGVVERMW